jgi:HEAT repeat protein
MSSHWDHLEADEEVAMSMAAENIDRKIDALMADLASNSGKTRQQARKSLVAIGEAAVAPLTAALDQADGQVRWEVAKALSEIGEPAAAPALINALEDEEGDIRWLAAEGLIAMGREGALPLLQALVHHSDSEWLREGAHHILRRQGGSDWSHLVAPVLAALEDIEPIIEVPPAAQAALDALTDSGRRDTG